MQHIRIKGPPVSARPRGLVPDTLRAAKAKLEQMLELGIIRPFKSPWASPLYILPKKSGDWRPCGDYRALNKVAVPDKHHIPHMHELTSALAADMLMASSSDEEQLHHLDAFLQRLTQHTVTVNPDKCELGQSSIDVLGHCISVSGIEALPNEIQALKDYPAPSSFKQLRRFLGLVNYYRRIIPNCASIV
ncbi:unnamed protein product [Dicrocoelium dendriticum]|nr:unnamed protein product [Dicrocoelium dendriticum]